jgi:GTP cyclohydrolase I
MTENSPDGVVDQERIAAAFREILLAIGEDPDREGLRDTPARVARMYDELFAGYREDPGRHFRAVFHQRYDEMVVVRDITFHSMCEHHMLPFMGKAHVAYIPDGKLVGISKIARVVDCFARRPQIQERLTEQIADLIMAELAPKGVAVVLEAQHTCMVIRGVRKPGSVVVTSALRGLCKSNVSTRNEAMNLLRQ